jgi:hypothetical protein
MKLCNYFVDIVRRRVSDLGDDDPCPLMRGVRHPLHDGGPGARRQGGQALDIAGQIYWPPLGWAVLVAIVTPVKSARRIQRRPATYFASPER